MKNVETRNKKALILSANLQVDEHNYKVSLKVS